MSKITNDGLTRSGTRCFILAVPMATWRQMVNEYTIRNQVGTRPDGRHDMRSSRIITDYRLSEKRSIFVGAVYSNFIVILA